MMQPLPAEVALNRYFHEARSKLLDLAAILDRIDRGGDVAGDVRLEKVRQALSILQEKVPGRAEKVQCLFSLDYDAAWEKPQPR